MVLPLLLFDLPTLMGSHHHELYVENKLKIEGLKGNGGEKKGENVIDENLITRKKKASITTMNGTSTKNCI